jgi:hypothetical protein
MQSEERGHADEEQTMADEEQTMADEEQTMTDEEQTMTDEEQTMADEGQTLTVFGGLGTDELLYKLVEEVLSAQIPKHAEHSHAMRLHLLSFFPQWSDQSQCPETMRRLIKHGETKGIDKFLAALQGQMFEAFCQSSTAVMAVVGRQEHQILQQWGVWQLFNQADQGSADLLQSSLCIYVLFAGTQRMWTSAGLHQWCNLRKLLAQ